MQHRPQPCNLRLLSQLEEPPQAEVPKHSSCILMHFAALPMSQAILLENVVGPRLSCRRVPDYSDYSGTLVLDLLASICLHAFKIQVR